MRLLFTLLICMAIYSCNNNKTPNVSNIAISLKTQRFEQSFFALDTNNFVQSLNLLITKYPSFGENFITTILGADPKWSVDSTAEYVKNFIAYSKTIFDTSQKYFSNFLAYEKEIKKGLQFVKYYYPTFKIPTKIITYIGPADGYGDALDEDAFIVGLHAHLGKDFPLYKTDMVQGIYPNYITANFTPNYIVINCMKNIVNDMYPEKVEDKRLLIQMIENGKRLWLLSKFLPETEEYNIMGYTKTQMKDCDAQQKNIWSLFIQNNFLQQTDNNLIKKYVSEGPKTQELGENAPGNIGSYAGWQIVKKYASKFTEVKVDSLMKMDAEVLYQNARYKP